MTIFKQTLLMLSFWSIPNELWSQAPIPMMIRFAPNVPWREIDSLRRVYQATQIDSTRTTNVRLWSIPYPIQIGYGGLSGILGDIETSYNAHGTVKASTDSLTIIPSNTILPGVRACFSPQFAPTCLLNPHFPTKIALIDTGIDSVVAIQDPYLKRFFQKRKSRNFSTLAGTDTMDVQDRKGHGTAIAHIVATIWAKNNMLDTNRGQEIIALRIFDANGVATQWSLVKALDYAIREKVRVINMSINWRTKKHRNSFNPTILQRIFQQAQDEHLLIVTSAGNDGADIDRDFVSDSMGYMPANLGYNGGNNLPPLSLYTVAATDCNDRLASFSNYGARSVPVAALGVNIPAKDHTGVLKYFSGTSMSSAIVAGLASVRAAQSTNNYMNSQFRDLLERNCSACRPSLNNWVQLGCTLLSENGEIYPNKWTFSVSPNPAKERVQIKFDAKWSTEIHLTLQNAVGQIIDNQKIMAHIGANVFEWHLPSHLNKGVYLLTLKSNLGVASHKIYHLGM